MISIALIKRIDWIIQALTFCIPALVALLSSNLFFLLYIPIYVGVVQVVSCLLNRVMLDDKYRSDQRLLYEQLLLVVIALSVLMFVFKSNVLAGIILLMAPFMALLYFFISVSEATYLGSVARRKRYI